MPPRKKAAPKNVCKMMCCTVGEDVAADIQADIDRWEAGLWAIENYYGPACHCGLRAAKEVCPRHGG